MSLDRRRRTLVSFLTLCLTIASLVLAGQPVHATGVRIVDCSQSYSFSESLTFNLKAESPVDVTAAVLFYGREGVPLTRRIYPDMVPGRTVSISHVEPLERGQYAPGTRFRTWWRLEMADGSAFLTDVQTFEYVHDRFQWQTVGSGQARIHYYGNEADRASKMNERALAAIDRLQSEIGITLTHPLNVYLYASPQDMQEALSSRSEGFDSRVMTLGVAVSEDTLLLLSSHSDAERTLAHELSHIVVGLATENPFTRLPRWLDEGLAMYAEGVLPEENDRALRRAIRSDSLLSVRSMSSYTGQASQVDLFYGEAYSLVDYMLRTYGRKGMSALLAVFGQGARPDDALQRALGLGVDELDNAWRASLGLGPRRRLTPSARVEMYPRQSAVVAFARPPCGAR